jgi:hypothetical protein
MYYKIDNPNDDKKKKFVAIEIKVSNSGFIKGSTLRETVKGWTNHDYVDLRFYTSKNCET